MKQKIQTRIAIPDGVTLTIKGSTVTAKGSQGELTRTFPSPKIKITVDDGELVITCDVGTQREKVTVFTAESHLANMMKGVSEGFEYKLKVCSGHFPMNVAVDKGYLTVKNLLGEVNPRKVKIKDGATVKIEGDIITVTAVDKEIAGQCAADIEKLCKRTNFDNRIFQDGIYIISKAGKSML